jgi:hypothetical protein
VKEIVEKEWEKVQLLAHPDNASNIRKQEKNQDSGSDSRVEEEAEHALDS